MKFKKLFYLVGLLLVVLHHDWWLWDDPTLVFGFLPVGLAYHALYSIAAAGVWIFIIKYSWPSETEAFSENRDKTEEKSIP